MPPQNPQPSAENIVELETLLDDLLDPSWDDDEFHEKYCCETCMKEDILCRFQSQQERITALESLISEAPEKIRAGMSGRKGEAYRVATQVLGEKSTRIEELEKKQRPYDLDAAYDDLNIAYNALYEKNSKMETQRAELEKKLQVAVEGVKHLATWQVSPLNIAAISLIQEARKLSSILSK